MAQKNDWPMAYRVRIKTLMKPLETEIERYAKHRQELHDEDEQPLAIDLEYITGVVDAHKVLWQLLNGEDEVQYVASTEN